MYRPEVKSMDEVLNEIAPGRFHFIVVSLAGLAYMCDGLAANMIGFSSTCAGDEFTLTTNQVSRVPNALFSGAIVGAIFFAQCADVYGRVSAMIFSISVIIFGFLFTGIVSSFWALVLGWFLIGCGAGGTGIAFDYVSEVVAIRARVSGFILQVFWPLATTIVGVLAWVILGSGSSWRILIFMLCIPAALSSILLYKYLPESGRWYLFSRRYDEAEEVVRLYAKMNGTILKPFSFSRGILENDNSVAMSFEESVSSGRIYVNDDKNMAARILDVLVLFNQSFLEFCQKTRDIFNEEMLYTTVSMGYLFFVSCLTTYGGMLLQARLLQEDESTGCTFEFGQYLLSGPAELAAGIIVILTTDIQGRRWSMAMWFFAVAVFSLILGFGVMGTTAAYTIGLLGIRFASFGSNIASWTPVTELYSTKYRATAFSFCYVMSRVGAIVSSVLVDSELEVRTISLMFAAMSAVAASCAFTVRETVGEPIN